jgi:hypothetical protein
MILRRKGLDGRLGRGHIRINAGDWRIEQPVLGLPDEPGRASTTRAGRRVPRDVPSLATAQYGQRQSPAATNAAQ